MQQVFASIITIGDELLIGQVTDTNSPWMAQELNKTGVWLKRRVAVGDLREEIVHALDEQSQDCQIIIMTGGLGPTADDITKEVLNDYFGGKMVTDRANPGAYQIPVSESVSTAHHPAQPGASQCTRCMHCAVQRKRLRTRHVVRA